MRKICCQAKPPSILLFHFNLPSDLKLANQDDAMKSLLLLAATFTFPFLFLSCASSSFVDMNSLKQELNVRDFPEQKDYPDADAVVLSEVHNVRVFIDENYDVGTTETITKVVKLFKNIEDYAFVEIPTSSGDKLTDLCARTIKPDGTVIELQDGIFIRQQEAAMTTFFIRTERSRNLHSRR